MSPGQVLGRGAVPIPKGSADSDTANRIGNARIDGGCKARTNRITSVATRRRMTARHASLARRHQTQAARRMLDASVGAQNQNRTIRPRLQRYSEFPALRDVTWTKVVRRRTFGNKYAGTARHPERLQEPVAITIMEPLAAMWETRRADLGKAVISDLAAPCWRCPGAA